MDAELAVSYEVLDLETHSCLASFDELAAARSALAAAAGDDPARARFLAVVAFDERGEAIAMETAEDLTPA